MPAGELTPIAAERVRNVLSNAVRAVGAGYRSALPRALVPELVRLGAALVPCSEPLPGTAIPQDLLGCLDHAAYPICAGCEENIRAATALCALAAQDEDEFNQRALAWAAAMGDFQNGKITVGAVNERCGIGDLPAPEIRARVLTALRERAA